MALYQPTNITPSSLGELGNGVVDITEDLTISWQVNGNTPMTQFMVQIYKNDATSTLVYSTGTQALTPPFAGKDALGNYVLFSHTVAASALESAGMANGAEYKLVITQWWGSGESESVRQTSASAFITRAKPTLTLDTIPDPLAALDYTFGATYTQAQGDPLNWVRWQIAREGQADTPLMDTGNIYSTPILSFTYDGLFSGTSYLIRCRIQTENGVEADTGWQSFTVQYDNTTLAGVVTVKPEPGFSGVRVSWPTLNYIPGTAEGTPTYTVNSISGGAPITWDTVSGADMELKAPWSIQYSRIKNPKGSLAAGPQMTLRVDETSMVFRYGDIEIAGEGGVKSGKGIEVTWGASRVAAVISGPLPTYSGGHISVILTPSQLVVRKVSGTKDEFYTAPVLLPELLNRAITGIRMEAVSPRFSRGGNIKVIQGGLPGLSPEETADAMTAADWGSGVVFATDFASKTLNAGNVDLGNAAQSLSVYRYADGAANLEHVTDTALSQDAIIDCGVVNSKPYTWYVFGTGGQALATSPVVSNPLTTCFWDWTILSCTTEDNAAFTPQAIYRFGYNIDSGSVTNNSAPSTLPTFTRYPAYQPSPANYASGTLSGLIGAVSRAENGAPQYKDTAKLRDEIYALSTTKNTLFLKDRKGSLRKIRVGGPIAMTTMDESLEQAQTMALPWVEVGSAEGVSIILTEDDALWMD